MTSTFALYKQLAVERPAKALRYRRSITETLARTNIHPIERERLTEALAGIADVLGDSHVCGRCGRQIESAESIAAGLGSHCRAVAS